MVAILGDHNFWSCQMISELIAGPKAKNSKIYSLKD